MVQPFQKNFQYWLVDPAKPTGLSSKSFLFSSPKINCSVKRASLNNKDNLNFDQTKYQNYYWNQCFDKGRIKNFVLWFLANYGEHRTVQLVEELKNVGFLYATKAGISLGIEDLKIPPKKIALIRSAEKETLNTVKQYNSGDITGVERFQRLIDSWHRVSEQLKQEVIDNFIKTDILNPVYMMAFSGARGNISQVRQLVGMRGLMANPQGQIIDFPIRSNFREGLTLTEYIISSYGARKGIVDTALRTANAGYLTRRLVDVAQHVIISKFDCGTRRGIFLKDMKEGNKTILSLQTRLIGRVLAQDVNVYKTNNSDKEKISNIKQKRYKLTLAKRNEEISLEKASLITKETKKVFVRSALTCDNRKLLCQLCYGWSLAQGNLVSIGEAVGVIAAQSIGEPGTQLTMRTFHTGGVFSGDISDQIRCPFNGIIDFNGPIPGTLIRTPEGKIVFLTKSSGSFNIYKTNSLVSFQTERKNNVTLQTKKYQIPAYTLLYVRNGEQVYEKQVVAQISSISRQKNATDEAEFTIKSEMEGQFFLKNIDLQENKVGPKLKKGAPSTKTIKDLNTGEEFVIPENSDFTPLPDLTKDLQAKIYSSKNQKIIKTKKNDFMISLYKNKKTKLESKTMSSSLKSNELLESVFSAWDWGYAWILSGKVYQPEVSAFYSAKVGDFLNRRSYINSFLYKPNFNISGVIQLDLNFDTKMVYKNKTSYLTPLSLNKNNLQTNNTSLNAKGTWLSTTSSSNHSIDVKPTLKNQFLFFQLKNISYKNIGYFLRLTNPFEEPKNKDLNITNNGFKQNLTSTNDLIFVVPPTLPRSGHHGRQTQFATTGTNAKQSLMQNQTSFKTVLQWFPTNFKAENPGFVGFEEIENLYADNLKPKNNFLKQPLKKNTSSVLQSLQHGNEKTVSVANFKNQMVGKTTCKTDLIHSILKIKTDKKQKLLNTNQDTNRFQNNSSLSVKFFTTFVNNQKTKVNNESGDLSPQVEQKTNKNQSLNFSRILWVNKNQNNTELTKSVFLNSKKFSSLDEKKISTYNSREKDFIYSSLKQQQNLTHQYTTYFKNTKENFVFKGKIESNMIMNVKKYILNKNHDTFVYNHLALFSNFFNKVYYSKLSVFGQNTKLVKTTTKLILFLKSYCQFFKTFNLKKLTNLPRTLIRTSRLINNYPVYRINLINNKNLNVETNFNSTVSYFGFIKLLKLNRLKNNFKIEFQNCSYSEQIGKEPFLNNKHLKNKTNFSTKFEKANVKDWIYVLFMPAEQINKLYSCYGTNQVIPPGQFITKNLMFDNSLVYINFVNVTPSLLPLSLSIKFIKNSLTKNQTTNTVKFKKGQDLIGAQTIITRETNLNFTNWIVNTKSRFNVTKDNSNLKHFAFNPNVNTSFKMIGLQIHKINEISLNSLKLKNPMLDGLKVKTEIQKLNYFNDKLNTYPISIGLQKQNPFKPAILNYFNFSKIVQNYFFNFNKNHPITTYTKIHQSIYQLQMNSMIRKDFTNGQKTSSQRNQVQTNFTVGKMVSPKSVFANSELNTWNNSLSEWKNLLATELKRQKTTDSVFVTKRLQSIFYKEKLKSFVLNKQQISGQVLTKYPNVDIDIYPQLSPLFQDVVLQKNKDGTSSRVHKMIQKNELFATSLNSSLVNNQFKMFSIKQIQQFFVTYLISYNVPVESNQSVFIDYPFKDYTFSFNFSGRYCQKSYLHGIQNFKNKSASKEFLSTYLTNETTLHQTKNDQNVVNSQQKNYSLVASVIPVLFSCPHISNSLIYPLSSWNPVSNNLFKSVNSNPGSTKINKNSSTKKALVSFYVNDFGLEQNIIPTFGLTQSPFAQGLLTSPFEGELIYNTAMFNKPPSKGKQTFVSNMIKTSSSKVLKRKTNQLYSFLSLIQNEPSFLQIKQNTSVILTKKDCISFYLPENFEYGIPKKQTTLASQTQFNLNSTSQNNQYLIKDIIIKQDPNSWTIESPEQVPEALTKLPKAKVEEIVSSVQKPTSLVQTYIKIPKFYGGLPLKNHKLALGEFFTYGDSIYDFNNEMDINVLNTKTKKKVENLVVTNSGQIIHLNRTKLTLRRGQPLFVSPKAIFHKYDGDFIEAKSPVITLSYQRLKTGDIVQGIPKIEQFFEARTTKRGRLFRDSLPNLLKALFKRYRRQLPLDQAVRQSFYKIQQIIVDGVLRVYRSQGVTIADKHLEIIVKQMTSKVRILEGGQTGFFPGEIVDLEFVEQVNSLLMKKIHYEPIILGITKSSLEVDSFLSAASFQQTTRVLTAAAIARKKDFLKGLKENVILGNLIPAGTGYLVYLDDLDKS